MYHAPLRKRQSGERPHSHTRVPSVVSYCYFTYLLVAKDGIKLPTRGFQNAVRTNTAGAPQHNEVALVRWVAHGPSRLPRETPHDEMREGTQTARHPSD